MFFYHFLKSSLNIRYGKKFVAFFPLHLTGKTNFFPYLIYLVDLPDERENEHVKSANNANRPYII